MIKANRTVTYLIRRCSTSFFVVVYLTYLAFTKTAMDVHSCIDVHDDFDVQFDGTTKYWSDDTSLKCHEGTHRVLAATIGWPVLIIVSIGCPIALAVFLLVERQRDVLKDEWLLEACGFLHHSYSHRYVFWEALIFLRKALLASIAVFSYSLGGNLQGILAVIVLIFFLYLQIICRPFREEFDELNELESFSLLVSLLTFATGLFLDDDHASQPVRILLTASTCVCMLGLLFFLCFSFLNVAASYAKKALVLEGIAHRPDGGTCHVLFVFVRTHARSFDNFCRNMMRFAKRNRRQEEQ